ncbi:MAG: hypothetical protein HQM15_06680 [Deltaproteobacteria bacterium]|nr:hypothetical protein [Deltaproteobacteria bacterium]
MVTLRTLDATERSLMDPASNVRAVEAALRLRDTQTNPGGPFTLPAWPAQGLNLRVFTGANRQGVDIFENHQEAFQHAVQNLDPSLVTIASRNTGDDLLNTYGGNTGLQIRVAPGSPLANRLESFVGNSRALRFFADNVDANHDGILTNEELEHYQQLDTGETVQSASYRARAEAVRNARTVFPSLLLFVRYSNTDINVIGGNQPVIHPLVSSVNTWRDRALGAVIGALVTVGLGTLVGVRLARRAAEATRREGIEAGEQNVLTSIPLDPSASITDPAVGNRVGPLLRAAETRGRTAARNEMCACFPDDPRTQMIRDTALTDLVTAREGAREVDGYNRARNENVTAAAENLAMQHLVERRNEIEGMLSRAVSTDVPALQGELDYIRGELQRLGVTEPANFTDETRAGRRALEEAAPTGQVTPPTTPMTRPATNTGMPSGLSPLPGPSRAPAFSPPARPRVATESAGAAGALRSLARPMQARPGAQTVMGAPSSGEIPTDRTHR